MVCGLWTSCDHGAVTKEPRRPRSGRLWLWVTSLSIHDSFGTKGWTLSVHDDFGTYDIHFGTCVFVTCYLLLVVDGLM